MPIKKTVIEWLSEVDYRTDKDYVPSAFSLDFINFIKLVNGDTQEENKTPVVHYRMLDQVPGKKQNIINMCCRGLSKTTIMAQYLILYIAVYGEIPGYGSIDFILYVADTIENNVKKMRLRLERLCISKPFLHKYLESFKFTDVRWYFKNKEGKELVVSGYGAKALALNTKLFTDTGFTSIGECKIGDKIFAPDGNLYSITAKSGIFNKSMYAITLVDGRVLQVSEDHINSIMEIDRSKRKVIYHSYDISTKELLLKKLYQVRQKVDHVIHERNIFIKNTEKLDYSFKQYKVDPYLLGLLLGDGSMREDGSVVLHAHKNDMPFYLTQFNEQLGSSYVDKRSNCISQAILKIHKRTRPLNIHRHGDYKGIPSSYMIGSVEQRLALLQGLLDTDGTISKIGRMSFCSNSWLLTYGVASLIRSLGGEARLRVGGNYKGKDHYKVEIKTNFNPFRLPRKATRFKQRVRTTGLVAITSIEKISDVPSQCISIASPDHQFLAGDYIRTHNTGVRGTVELGTRPQLALLDDLLSDDDARSPTVISSIEDTIYQAIEFAMHPAKKKIIWSGTPFNAKDPLYKAVESGAWYVNVYPICNEFPCKEEDFVSAWPDRFNYGYVKDVYDKLVRLGKVASFNQELMLRIMSEEDRLIRDVDIRWYSIDAIKSNKGAYNFYITTDFATSEETAADFSVISVWALNSKGWWFWVDGICKKQLMDRNIDDLFRLTQKWKPQQVGIEVSGQQGGFIPWIQREMLDKNTWFTLASENNSGKLGIRPLTNKMARFNVVVPWFKAGYMYFPIELKETDIIQEFLNELSLISPSAIRSKYDDCLDTISMLSCLTPWRPSEDIELTQTAGSDIWEAEDNEDDVGGRLSSYIV